MWHKCVMRLKEGGPSAHGGRDKCMKGIVNNRQSGGDGCGEPSVRAQTSA